MNNHKETKFFGIASKFCFVLFAASFFIGTLTLQATRGSDVVWGLPDFGGFIMVLVAIILFPTGLYLNYINEKIKKGGRESIAVSFGYLLAFFALALVIWAAFPIIVSFRHV